MSPYRNRLKTPEEIELGRKRDQLTLVQRQVAESERIFVELKSDIRQFEQVYEQVLGVKIHELEELEWQLKGLLGIEDPVDGNASSVYEETFAQFSHRTDLLDDDLDSTQNTPQMNLKKLYREVAKTIHPDLSADEDERFRRQELMAMANHAYENGDRRVLEGILCDWEQGPELVSGVDVAMELVRIIRLIARAEQDIHAFAQQVEELKETDIFHFKVRVDEAMVDGIDLMAEMAARVDLDISRTRRRLAVLQGDHAGNLHGNTPETRLIRFPSEACGVLYERSSDSVDFRDWKRLGTARGVREVFLDKAIRLDVKGDMAMKLGFLDALLPEDLQALFLHGVDDTALVHLQKLTGLRELYLSNTLISDNGIRQLLGLHGLRRLYVYHTAIGDAALFNLAEMKGLKWLTCSGTNITDDGLSRFRQMLSTCKAANFEWRHGK
ncbi:J domain-containing protein [Pelotalea chapellei]|uniref:J domain-containing protein n=1 Tax=Pelotalea chapellei TaxID=44671 RepID=A0ABS5U817_9BACT|nr:J domain-containing protein [Pelotalea chapellei]MBT1071794.1 J domain-containing protein [Pelotalea chapellei]